MNTSLGLGLAQKPKMILFGYKNTLYYEPLYHSERGIKALLTNASANPNALSAKTLNSRFAQLHKEIAQVQAENQISLSQSAMLRLLFAMSGIRLPMTALEMETVFMENALRGRLTDGVAPLLELLDAKGIRTGIISNTSFSGEALTLRFHMILPAHAFEFIVTAGDFIFQKPNRILFDIALQKANLLAEEVWFCGNDFHADIEGAHGAGILPIWYTKENDGQFAPAGLKVTQWEEVIRYL